MQAITVDFGVTSYKDRLFNQLEFITGVFENDEPFEFKRYCYNGIRGMNDTNAQ